MNVERKIVNFEKWCGKCEHHSESEFDPNAECYECLYDPMNVQTDRPTHYAQNKKNRRS